MNSYIQKRNEFYIFWRFLTQEDIDRLAEALNQDCDTMLEELERMPENSHYHKENIEYMKRLISPTAMDNFEDGLGYKYGEIRNWYSTLYTNDFYLKAIQLNETASFAFPKSFDLFQKFMAEKNFLRTTRIE